MRAAGFLVATTALVAMLAGGATRADVMISKKATANMSCSAGVCSPTAAKAVLNATDLANMLAAGDVRVVTGSGATNIVVKEGFSWTAASRLTLDAIQSVEFDKPVTVAGTGAVTIATNDGGSGGDLLFGDKGNLTFWDLSSSLVINGNSFTLVGDIQTLAAAVASNPTGLYAFAEDYDASVDGTYSSAPVGTTVAGTIEGLNHKIQNLALSVTSGFDFGLFATSSGTLRDIQVTNAAVSAGAANGGILLGETENPSASIIACVTSGTISFGGGSIAGGLVGAGKGLIDRSHASVSINADTEIWAGGLVGQSQFAISRSYATGSVTGGDNSFVGGLVGSGGDITQSYATGNVVAGGNSSVGGLSGADEGSAVTNVYATGQVRGGATSNVGGLVGQIAGLKLQSSYSAGFVKGGTPATSGGFIGISRGGDDLGADYWDMDTSGKGKHQGHGDCQDANCGRAIKGLTNATLQAGLPEGFDPSVWGEKKNINGGLPYLLAVPPAP